MTRILDRNGAPIGELGSEKRTVVPYDAIPKLLIDAVVSAEDADYFNHGGLDYRGMVRAFLENVLRGRRAQGGSTITQQVVKTLLLSPERTLRRKVQEIILARQLSQKLSKEEVLALYLNQIYYGHGRYGCEEAARYFFGKSVRDVNLAEAALLAGLPQSPERLSPRKHPDAAKTRQRYVLGQMAERGYIDRRRPTGSRPSRFAWRASRPRRAGWPRRRSTSWGRYLRGSVTRRRRERHHRLDHARRAPAGARARPRSSAGWKNSTRARASAARRPTSPGKALDKRHAELAAHATGLRDGQIVEGLVTRVEPEASEREARPPVTSTSACARSGNEARAAVKRCERRPARQGPRPTRARRSPSPSRARSRSKWGSPTKLSWRPRSAQGGRRRFRLEPRYGKGTKPLAERFKPGDLVRVRSAAERPHAEGPPSRWRSSWGRRRPWW